MPCKPPYQIFEEAMCRLEGQPKRALVAPATTDHECPRCFTKFGARCCTDYVAYRAVVEALDGMLGDYIHLAFPEDDLITWKIRNGIISRAKKALALAEPQP